MLITLVGLVLVVLAAVFVAWPLLAGSPPEEVESPIRESELEKEKDSALRAIRDADFDHNVGKLSDDDHAALRAELEQRALRAITALDAASGTDAAGGREASAEPGLRAVRGHGGGTAEAAGGGFCPSCGHRFGREATFCAGCGKKLPSGERGSGRRRATS